MNYLRVQAQQSDTTDCYDVWPADKDGTSVHSTSGPQSSQTGKSSRHLEKIKAVSVTEKEKNIKKQQTKNDIIRTYYVLKGCTENITSEKMSLVKAMYKINAWLLEQLM